MNHFAEPYAFWLLLLPMISRALLPAVKGLHGDALRVPFLKDLQRISIKSGKLWETTLTGNNKISPRLIFLYTLWCLLVLALARPQWLGEPIRMRSYSRDVLMVMDISNSMQEPDFAIQRRRVDRLTAVKKVAKEFISKRQDDRMGLILFGTNAYLQAPITFDKKSVSEILLQMDAGMAGNSTAIGDALGLALKTLKDSPNKDKKVIILLTDGENNDGSLTLPQAISLAKQEGVKIYTIGVGADNSIMQSFMGYNLVGNSALDEKSLQEIAKETQGRYFRAKDTNSLEKVYQAIDKLEPTINDNQYVQETKELYYIPLLMAFFLGLGMIMVIRRHK